MAYSPCHLSQILNVYPEEESLCIGWAKTQGRLCQNSVKPEERRRACHLLEKAGKMLYAGQSVDSLLEDIAYYCLCKRWHRKIDIPEISARWRDELNRHFVVQGSPPIQLQHLNAPNPPASRSPLVTHQVSHRDNNAEWSLKVTLPLASTSLDHRKTNRERPRPLYQAQPQETRPSVQSTRTIHSSSSSSSLSPSSTAVEDPSTEMFARTHRTRRVMMPTSRINRRHIQPAPVLKEHRTGGKLVAKASSSFAPVSKVSHGPPLHTAERNRVIDEYMHTLRRMVPPEEEDEEDAASRQEEHKSEIARELRAIVTAAPRTSASRATQTKISGDVLERHRVLHEYVEEVKLMKPGRDTTDDKEPDYQQLKTSLIRELARTAKNVKDAGVNITDVNMAVNASTMTSTETPKNLDIKPVEDAATASTNTPKDLDVDDSAAEEIFNQTDTVQIKDAKPGPIVTENLRSDDKEDLASASSYSSAHSDNSLSSSTSSLMTVESVSASSYSSAHSNFSPTSTAPCHMSIDSAPACAVSHRSHNRNDNKNINTALFPYYSFPNPPTQLQSHSSPEAQAHSHSKSLPQPPTISPPNEPPTATKPPNTYPALTKCVAVGLAVVETVSSAQRWMGLEGRGSLAFFCVVTYLWTLSSVGIL